MSLIHLGIETSAFFALVYVVTMILAGLALIRRQGIALLSELNQREIDRGIRSIFLADDLRIVIAGLLFLIPGLFSDLIALILLIGPIRRHFIPKVHNQSSQTGFNDNRETGFTIDGSFTRVDDRPPKDK